MPTAMKLGGTADKHQTRRKARLLVGFDVIDEVGESIQPLLHGECQLVVHCSQEVCHLSGC